MMRVTFIPFDRSKSDLRPAPLQSIRDIQWAAWAHLTLSWVRSPKSGLGENYMKFNWLAARMGALGSLGSFCQVPRASNHCLGLAVYLLLVRYLPKDAQFTHSAHIRPVPSLFSMPWVFRSGFAFLPIPTLFLPFRPKSQDLKSISSSQSKKGHKMWFESVGLWRKMIEALAANRVTIEVGVCADGDMAARRHPPGSGTVVRNLLHAGRGSPEVFAILNFRGSLNPFGFSGVLA